MFLSLNIVTALCLSLSSVQRPRLWTGAWVAEGKGTLLERATLPVHHLHTALLPKPECTEDDVHDSTGHIEHSTENMKY